MDEAQELNEKLKEKRRALGISETAKPTRVTLKSLNEAVPQKKDEPKPHRVLLGSRWLDSNTYMEVEDDCSCETCNDIREKDRIAKEQEVKREEEEKAHLLQEQADDPLKWLREADVPKKYFKASFDTFQGGDAIKEMCKTSIPARESILLSGKTGCGKTHLAVAMLHHFITTTKIILPYGDPYYSNRDSRPSQGPRFTFASVPELLLEIRESFRKDSEESESAIIDRYSEVGLLILDDLGAEKATEWVESTLYLILDRRNRWERWTIITSNLTLPEIEQHLGARIASRLADMKVVNIKLPDYRKKRALQ